VAPISTRQTVSTMPSTTRESVVDPVIKASQSGSWLFRSEIEKDEIDQEDLF
jgi:hypothetical protein